MYGRLNSLLGTIASRQFSEAGGDISCRRTSIGEAMGLDAV